MPEPRVFSTRDRSVHLAINAIPLRPGGGLTVILGLLTGLRETHMPLKITVFARHPETVRAIRESNKADHVEVILAGAGAARSTFWQNWRFGKVLQQHRVDVLLGINHHLKSVHCPQIVYHLNLRRFIKLEDVASPLETLRETFRNIASKRALQSADVNVFESEYLRSRAFATYPHIQDKSLSQNPAGGCQRARNRALRNGFGTCSKSVVSYIGLPDEVVERSQGTSAQYAGNPSLLAVTSPFAHKDNPTLLRTMAELIRREPEVDWSLRVAGGGNSADWQKFLALASELGVLERVNMLGFCPHDKLDHLLRSSLCLIAPSVMESFAMVALEAMARRCPAIVANTTAMPESVGDAAILTTPRSPEAFADAVQKVYHETEFREQLIQRGLAWIQGFRWSRCGQDFAQIIERLVA